MPQYSRRSVLEATDLLACKLTHAKVDRFLLELGTSIKNKVDCQGSLLVRMNCLMEYYDNFPEELVDGQPIGDVIVKKAASVCMDLGDGVFDPVEESFRRALRRDGVECPSLRRALPKDVEIPTAESEMTQLLKKHCFETTLGHYEQAIEAHTGGNWASANSQLRTFIESLFDDVCRKLSSEEAASGHVSRGRLAELGFLSNELNEWDGQGKGFINGLVRRLHPQGSHPGLSDEDDSTFRLHIVLLTARLMLRRYDTWRDP